MLKLYLLGPPRVELDGTPVDIKRRKALALLVYLAVSGQPHSRDALATLFFPDQDQQRARAYLRRDLAALNTSLPGAWLAADRETVELQVDHKVWLDVEQFRRCVVACQSHNHPTEEVCADCLPLLTEAAALYSDHFLAGFTLRDAPEFDDWQFFQAESLRQEYALILERLVKGLSLRADYEAAMPHARRWVALDPLHEPAQQALMQVYALAGQQAAALRQYEEYADLLEQEFGLPPEEETTTLYEAIKAQRLVEPFLKAEEPRSRGAGVNKETISAAPPPPRSAAPAEQPGPRHNLPAQATPFVGRQRELAEISQLISAEEGQRLLTLVGPGGIGKTRLALAAAEAAKEAFSHGVYFVPLAPLKSAEYILSTLAESLEFRFSGQGEPEQQLLDYLEQKSLLLVLDNFEHVLAGAALVAEILQAAPQVRIVATSRERLNLSSETVLVVGGMAYPAAGQGSISAETAANYSAVKLLLQQARLVRSDFSLDKEEIEEVARICRLVEGMPLAIVLAASWLEVLSLAEIAEEIGRSLDFLETELRDVPDRQRSMRAVFASSWERLKREEQQIFMKLAVFRGGFSRQAAENVAGAGLRALRVLVNKSFISLGPNGRYEIHELLRQYGEAQLAETGQVEPTRQLHSDYYLEALGQREADLKGGSQIATLAEIEADLENIRAAWAWALQQKNEAAIDRALEALHLFIDLRTLHVEEGIGFFRLARRRLAPPADKSPGSVWGRIVVRLSFMQLVTTIVEADIEADIKTSLAIAKQHEDRAEIAFCQLVLGAYTFYVVQEPLEALELFEQSLEHFQALDDRFYMARALNLIGMVYSALSRLADAERFAQQSLALAKELGNQFDATLLLSNLAEASLGLGRYAEAENYARESMTLANQMGQRSVSAMSEILLSLGQFLEGNFETVEKCLGKNLAVAKETHFTAVLAQATAFFSLWAALSGDNALSQQYGRESLAMLVNAPFSMGLANWGLAIAHCNLKQYPAARQCLQAALNHAQDYGSLAMQIWLLPVAAVILAAEGQLERAVEWLALASTHPLSPTGWFAAWPALAAAQTDLKAELGADDYQAAWQRGQTLAVETVLAELRPAAESASKLAAEQAGQPQATAATGQRFVQETLIASGGMGEVYQGRDTETGQRVAIKRLKSELAARNPEAIRRLIREGEILRQLDHPNIVKLLAVIEAGPQPLLVMEYLPGGSLQNLLDKQSGLPLPQALNIGLELADALARTHHLGIIHRDLKPGNVLLAEDGTPRLTDFGVAYLAQQETRLTQEGAILGTSVYLSPEAWRGEELDARSDVWSFGALLYEMLVGRPPFAEKSIAATVTAILSKPLPDLAQLHPEIPVPLVELINQMLVKERDKRLDSMRQVAATLELIQRSRRQARDGSLYK